MNANTGRCLDSNRVDAGFGWAYIHACNNGPNQKWDVQVQADGTRVLKNYATGLCLDYNDQIGVHTRGCSYNTFQRWYVDRPWWWPSGIAFRHQWKSGVMNQPWCLDDHGIDPMGNLRLFAGNGSDYQRWL